MSAIVDYLESLRVFQQLSDRGRPPSIAEYRDAIGLASSSSTMRRIERLIELGWVEYSGRRTGEARSYVVSERGRHALGLEPARTVRPAAVPALSGHDVEYGGCA